MTEDNHRVAVTIELFRDDGDDAEWAVMARIVGCRGRDTAGTHLGERTLVETIQAVERLAGQALKWKQGAHCLTAQWRTDERHALRFGEMLDLIGKDCDE